jgi:myo-inositol 2-dehydrogenase/D-chiro-inositol 1-dehydrogenase
VGNTYAQASTTSQAPPHVAGVAGLIWSVNPDLRGDAVRALLVNHADDVGPPGRDDETGAGRVEADPLAVIENPAVGAVLIASPDRTHADLTLACLEAGKPVLCEKPLAPTPEDCLRVVEAEMTRGRRLVQVGFMRRFDPAYAEMKRTLSGGRLGRPLLFHCVHRNAAPPAFFEAGMLVTNAAVHEVDIARWLLGGEIVRARVIRSSSDAIGAYRDLMLIVLENEAGNLIEVEIFMSAGYGYDIRGEVVCEHGTVALAPPANTRVRHAGAETFSFAADWRGRFADAYRLQLQGWVGAIAAGGSVGASAWDGYAATAVAAACLESLSTGEPAVVRMRPRPSFYA